MHIPVFYSSQMVADSGSYSPSAGKPEQVVQSWGLLSIPMQITAPRPVRLTTPEPKRLQKNPAFVMLGSELSIASSRCNLSLNPIGAAAKRNPRA